MPQNPAPANDENTDQGAKDAQDEIVRENESFSVPQEDTALETESGTEDNR